MSDDLLTPVKMITIAAEHLQSEESGLLSTMQEQSINAILQGSSALYTLLVTLPALSGDAARELLSYEARTLLTSIIGYAELLLEPDEGTLSPLQTQHIGQIRTSGRRLLIRIDNLIDP